MALIGGMGKNNRDGITEIKSINKKLKYIHRNLFKDVGKPPSTPDLKISSLGDRAILNWGWNEDRVRNTEEKVLNGFRFEGYNVYQLPDSEASLNDPKTVKLATFDVKNGVTVIDGWKFLKEYGKKIFVPIQKGSDSGVKHYFIVDADSVKKTPLYRGSTYYFAVTAYSYNPDMPDYPSLESKPNIKAITIESEKPGTRYFSEPETYLKVDTVESSNLMCQVKVIDPSAVTGHEYEVYFTQNPDTTASWLLGWVWNLKDITLNQDILKNQPIQFQSEVESVAWNADNDPLIVDGLMIKVFYETTPDKFKAIVQVADADGPLTSDEFDYKGRPYQGNNVWQSLSSPNDANRFYLSSSDGKLSSLTRNWVNLEGHDLELRFTDQTSLFLWYYDSVRVHAQVPFELWDIGSDTYDDTSDDVRLIGLGYSGGVTPGVFDFGYKDPHYGFPASDWIFARKPLNEKGSYQAFVNDITGGEPNYSWFENSAEVLSNLIICDYAGAEMLPPTGTIVRFISAKMADENLRFTFTAPLKIENDNELIKKDVEKINVFPNPYYGVNSQESSRFTHFVTFNHLPKHAVIRIFTLNGSLVRKLEKYDNTQFFRWDLKNEKGWGVASGLYIVHIEMPELKKQKILKLMVIMTEEVLEHF
ncbi:MAG: T9SS type A sorting domain-containing protein [Calditrichaeota bacterium]|nr:T9SS type A sorting domain-containing protein [Calditrichota bacterium]